jgi:cell division protein FtsN
MNYDISFNKKTAGVIFAGGILAGSLLFFSGYKIGLDRGAVRAKAEMEKSKDIPPVAVTAPAPSSDASVPAENVPQEPAVDANPTSDSYSVQIGVFLTEDAAQQLQRKFGGRGYSAYVFEGRDNASQTWYAVRIGHFRELGPATRTAVNFTMNERLPAHVRPGNGL